MPTGLTSKLDWSLQDDVDPSGTIFHFAHPAPLPLLGGAVAIGWSRRIRRRLKQAQQRPER